MTYDDDDAEEYNEDAEDNDSADDGEYNEDAEDNDSADEGEVDDGEDPVVEWEQEDDDGSSNDEEIERKGNRHYPTASFSQRKFRDHLEKMNDRRNWGRGLAKKPRSTRREDPTNCQTARKSATPTESSGVDLGQIQLVHAYTRKESAHLREGHIREPISVV